MDPDSCSHLGGNRAVFLHTGILKPDRATVYPAITVVTSAQILCPFSVSVQPHQMVLRQRLLMSMNPALVSQKQPGGGKGPVAGPFKSKLRPCLSSPVGKSSPELVREIPAGSSQLTTQLNVSMGLPPGQDPPDFSP